ncbi:hypothetical protein [Streptomyces roseicoloratus]|uniref:Low molecular weight antigen MTB12-like C-terminal domain-containing protein n=1 Tax=Streptomyces roseicoloratus TaxID=2508722 RepID=A0ABY9S406_9ACTN|nr:hypothetical protein [Streptomyces roseicoloratus]WMX49055.1 hypothetical protein RGF97_27295 [Streptomyces roseicoloratus]
MVLKRRATAFAAAAVLALTPVVAGCSDDGGSGSDQGTPTVPPVPSAPTGSDRPADPAAAEAEVTRNWTAFFDPKTPAAERVKLLENGESMAPVLGAFAGDKNAQQTSVKVKEVTFTSPTGADVTYDLLVAGNTALPDAKGTSVLQNDTWKVSVKTLCGLVQVSGATVPGC